jgi:hypothetical protein
MAGKTFAVKTRVKYLGLPITVIGTVDGRPSPSPPTPHPPKWRSAC